MKFVLVLSISLISLIAAGQSGKSHADFVSGYFQDSSSENFERILAYYDSINENFVNPADCWRYCIDIYVDSNGVLFNGKQLENLDNLPNLLFEFLKNPKKFKFGSSTDQDFGTKGVIEIFFNKGSIELGQTVVKLALQAMKQFTAALEQNGIVHFDSNGLGEYVLNHLRIDGHWLPPEPPESMPKAKN